MKLVSCEIINFGKLSDFNYNFDDKLNYIYGENAWGKSTLAAFIRVMFFGFANESMKGKKNGEDNLDKDRIRYMPWNKGLYGGKLTFELGGKMYTIVRQFGSKKSEDDFYVEETDGHIKTDKFSDNIGQEVFNIDEESFKNSIFISQKSCQTMATSSISAKIGNLDDKVEDLNKFDKINDDLKKEISGLNKNKTGKIKSLKDDISKLKREIKEEVVLNKSLDNILNKKNDLNQRLVEAQKNKEVKLKLQEEISKNKDSQAKMESYKKILEDYENREKEFEEAGSFFKENIPDEESINEHKDKLSRIMILKENMMNLSLKDDERDLLEKKESVPGNFLNEEERELFFCFSDLFEDITLLEKDVEKNIKNSMDISNLKNSNDLIRKEIELNKNEALMLTEQMKNEEHMLLDEQIRIKQELKKLDEEKEKAEFERRKKEEEKERRLEEIEKKKEEKKSKRHIGILACALGLIMCLCSALLFNIYLGDFSIILTVIGLAFVVMGGYYIMSSIKKEEIDEPAISIKYNNENDSKEDEQNYLKLNNRLEEIKELLEKKDDNEIAKRLIEIRKKLEENEKKLDQNKANLKEKLDLLIDLFAKLNIEMTEETPIEVMEDSLLSFKKNIDRYKEIRLKIEGENKANELKKAELEEREKKFRQAKEEKKKLEDDIREYILHLGLDAEKDLDLNLKEIEAKYNDFLIKKNECERAQKIKEDFLEENKDIDFKKKDFEEDANLKDINEEINSILNDIENIKEDLRNTELSLEECQKKMENICNKKEELSACEEDLEEKQHKLKLLEKVSEMMLKAKENMARRYMEPLLNSFEKYYNMIVEEGGEFRLDARINLSKKEEGFERQIAALSEGYKDICGLCLRMAFVDTMYEGEKPFIVLDDPFVNIDSKKMTRALEFLRKLSEDYQLIYFSCHNIPLQD